MATSNSNSNTPRNTTDQIERTCLHCHENFYLTLTELLHTKRADFCSYECSGAARRGEKHYNWKGGSSDYRGGNWPQQRKLAYERDSGVCQICHRKPKKGEKKFAVHHITPFRNFNGDYMKANDLTNLSVVCENCHMTAERGLVPIQRPLL